MRGGLVAVVVEVISTEILEQLMVLRACRGDDLEAGSVCDLDGPLTDGGASRPDQNLRSIIGHLDGALGEVRYWKSETVEESLSITSGTVETVSDAFLHDTDSCYEALT